MELLGITTERLRVRGRALSTAVSGARGVVHSCIVSLLVIAAITSPAGAGARYTLITLLHTNDIHGRVVPRGESGGLARAATIVRQIRSQMPNVLLIDGGDMIHGTAEDALCGGRATVTAMNAAGYQLACAGNHEFDFGLPVLHRVLETARFAIVSANIRATAGGDWDGLAEAHIFSIGGVRVGVLGITSPSAVRFHWPNRIKDLAIYDPYETARKLIPRLRAQADVVVLASHMGDEEDEQLARQNPGIDFIVGGHSHTMITRWRWVGNTLITQAGAYGRAVGRIDFIVRQDEKSSKIVSVNGRNSNWSDLPRSPLGRKYPGEPLIPVDASVPEDPAVRDAYLPFRKHADRVLAEVVGQAPQGLAGRGTQPVESEVGDLAADAVRALARTDVAFVSIGSLDPKGIPPGPVTVGSVFNLFSSFRRQHIVTVSLTGADLQRAIDSGFAMKNVVNVAISGASVDYELRGRTPVVRRLLVGGNAVQPERTYTLAAQGYVMINVVAAAPGAKVLSEPDDTPFEAIVRYIRARHVVIPGQMDRIRLHQDAVRTEPAQARAVVAGR